MVVRSENDAGAALLHLPPRSAAGASVPVPDGTVRVIPPRLAEPPQLIAAWENRVYLVFPPENGAGSGRQRRVLSLGAFQGPLGDRWSYDHEADGRLRPHPSLPGDRALLGVVGSERGLFAMLGEPRSTQLGSEASGYELLLLSGSGWASLALPPGVPASGVPTQLVALVRGVGLLMTGSDGATGLWVGRFKDRPDRGDQAAPANAGSSVDWAWRPLSFAPLRGSQAGARPPAGRLLSISGQLVFADRAGDGRLTISSVSEDGVRELADLTGVPAEYAVAPLDGSGRVAVLWSEPEASADAATTKARTARAGNAELREVSVLTGRVLYAGPALAGGPLSSQDFRFLALVMLGMMVIVLVFIVRPEAAAGEAVLPDDAALAEPSRRVVAAVIDFVPALLFTVRVFDMPASEMLTPAGLFGGAGPWPILTLLGVGFLHCTIGEWLIGRSLGKLLTGCEVVDVRAGRPPALAETGAAGGRERERRPRLWQAAVRNGVKWAVPPVPVLGLGEPSRRHRGDVLARTAVVVRLVPEDQTDEREG